MSFPGPVPRALASLPFDGPFPGAYQAPPRPRRRWLLSLTLLVLTLCTTTTMGTRLALNFQENVPPLGDRDWDVLSRIVQDPSLLFQGLPFSLTLMTILLAHELGHFLACQFYRIDATLPYFLPAPTLIGTFGAFIRIRSPIYTRRILFDVGIAGPIAGFLFLLPALAIGIAYSKVLSGIATQGDLVFGVPLLERLVAMAVFPGIPSSDIYLHPVARAAWVGLLATALNLLPIGQLDGGHILYSLIGSRWHRFLSKAFIIALIPLGFVSPSWWFWAAFLFFFALRHPVIYDETKLGSGRNWLGLLALVIFLLSFTVTPVSLGEGG